MRDHAGETGEKQRCRGKCKGKMLFFTSISWISSVVCAARDQRFSSYERNLNLEVFLEFRTVSAYSQSVAEHIVVGNGCCVCE